MKHLLTIILTTSFLTLLSQEFEHKEYHENGKLKVEYSGKKGVPDGILKMYYSTGELQGDLLYKKGRE